jgi:phosphohistidine swiveling domain-containing protein
VQEEARKRSVANVDFFTVIAAGSAYATAAELNAREGADHVLVLRNFHRRAGSWLRRARACVQEEARKRSVANVDFFTVIAAGSADATAAELNAREGADHVLVLRNFHRRAGSWLRRARACVQEEARHGCEDANVLVLPGLQVDEGRWLRRARACVQEEVRRRSVANVDSFTVIAAAAEARDG